jgi:hypothetical protein
MHPRLRAIGGIEVDLAWANSRVTSVRLVSSLAQSVTLELGGEQRGVQLTAGLPVDLAFSPAT